MTATLFRSRAVANSAGPERLDERIRVVTVRAWVGAGIGVLVALALLGWAVLGTTTHQVDGVALLVHQPHTFTVEAPVYGVLTEEPPPVGSTVTAGQRIAAVRSAADPGAAPVPVLAPIGGVLISVVADRGTVLVQAQDIAYVELAGAPLVAQVFVPTGAGKRISPGMAAEVEPSVAPAADYGRIRATVSAVSRYSLSPDRIRTVTGNDVLAARIIAGPPVLLVTLALRTAAGRPDWTTGHGPPFAIESGTIGTASVTLSTEHPLDALFAGAGS
jgi:hypothetical protein